MRYWHIRQSKGEWYAWDVSDPVESWLNIKDAIHHTKSIKELLFHLQALSEHIYDGERAVTIDTPFDSYGRYIPIKE